MRDEGSFFFVCFTSFVLLLYFNPPLSDHDSKSRRKDVRCFSKSPRGPQKKRVPINPISSITPQFTSSPLGLIRPLRNHPSHFYKTQFRPNKITTLVTVEIYVVCFMFYNWCFYNFWAFEGEGGGCAPWAHGWQLLNHRYYEHKRKVRVLDRGQRSVEIPGDARSKDFLLYFFWPHIFQIKFVVCQIDIYFDNTEPHQQTTTSGDADPKGCVLVVSVRTHFKS